jgi:cation:H+ antiporter
VAAVGQLALGLAVVFVSAWLFTRGLEAFGARLGLEHGALGSVFAALGTALPESSVAVLAAVAPGPGPAAPAGEAVSVGAVLGAPLLLATLGFAVLGLAGLRAGRAGLHVDTAVVRRDLGFFLLTFGAAAAAGTLGLPAAARQALALALVASYVAFVSLILRKRPGGVPGGPDPSHRRAPRPAWTVILAQLAAGLGAMFVGANLFVHTLTAMSAAAGLSGFVLAALITPLATELPETANSVVWVARGQDSLAAGNVTGALSLQGAVIPAVGMVCTPWRFHAAETVAAAVALAGAGAVLLTVRGGRRLRSWPLLAAGALYPGFVAWVL